MSFSEIVGIIAGVIALIAFIPYIWGILRGKTKPNRASWFIWAVLGGAILASYYSSGATTTIWIPIVYTVMPIIIFLLSIKYGVGGLSYLDVFCIVGAVLGLLLWKLTNSPEAALYLNIFVDALGFLPTIKKAYLQPKSESKISWYIGASSTIINLFAINSWSLDIALYPIYLAVFNSVVAILLIGVVQKKFRPKLVN